MARETVLPFLHIGVHRFSEMCILSLFTWKHRIHSHHLVLMVDIGSCLQQSLDCLGVSHPSSYPQRKSAILYESMRDKRTVIASEDH